MIGKELHITPARVIFLIGAVLCLSPFLSSALALLLGMAISLTVGNPYLNVTKNYTHRLLQASVIGMGAGMNLTVIAQVGLHGIGYTAIGIILTLLVGGFLGRFFGIDRNTSMLVSVGTAICGGSAIAAVAPTIRAKSQEVSVALATVFFLNAIALLIFPGIGHYFNLSQTQFGLWSALAIHDTSSVVGAAIQYGSEALEVATTVKLARALWIIPATLFIGMTWDKKADSHSAPKAKKPWFILWFLVAAALVTWVPGLQQAGQWATALAKRTMVLTLFFIGSGLTLNTVKSVGVRPFAQGFGLWLLMGSATLGAILASWIQI